jgi:hypothetical protein
LAHLSFRSPLIRLQKESGEASEHWVASVDARIMAGYEAIRFKNEQEQNEPAQTQAAIGLCQASRGFDGRGYHSL